MLRTIAKNAFGADYPLFAGRAAVKKAQELGGAVAVFGHGWGGELRLPQRGGVGSYFVDLAPIRRYPDLPHNREN